MESCSQQRKGKQTEEMRMRVFKSKGAVLCCIGSDVTCFRCRISNHLYDTCVDIT